MGFQRNPFFLFPGDTGEKYKSQDACWMSKWRCFSLFSWISEPKKRWNVIVLAPGILAKHIKCLLKKRYHLPWSHCWVKHPQDIMNHPRAPFVKKEVEVHFVYESVKNHNDAVGGPRTTFCRCWCGGYISHPCLVTNGTGRDIRE